MYSVMNKIFENFYIQQFHIYILAIKENLGKSQVLYIGIALDFHWEVSNSYTKPPWLFLYVA